MKLTNKNLNRNVWRLGRPVTHRTTLTNIRKYMNDEINVFSSYLCRGIVTACSNVRNHTLGTLHSSSHLTNNMTPQK